MNTEQFATPMYEMLSEVYIVLKKRRRKLIRKEDAELAQLEMQIGALLGKIALAVDSHQAS